MNTPLKQAEQDGLTVLEFVELQKKKGKFDKTANGFKKNISQEITADDLRPSAQELLNEVEGLSPQSHLFFKNTKPVKESSYYDYRFARGKK